MTNIASTLRAGHAPSARRRPGGQGSLLPPGNDEMFLSWLSRTELRRVFEPKTAESFCPRPGDHTYFTALRSIKALRRPVSAADFGLGCRRWTADLGLVLGVESRLDDVELALLEVADRQAPPALGSIGSARRELKRRAIGERRCATQASKSSWKARHGVRQLCLVIKDQAVTQLPSDRPCRGLVAGADPLVEHGHAGSGTLKFERRLPYRTELI